mmetsp:Transcript_91619/g.231142  ORF Transcript_91619/g.231142 Transcript_91619/m.231142 type:complete len:270 (+) Transcript_91619:752-1561(+)
MEHIDARLGQLILEVPVAAEGKMGRLLDENVGHRIYLGVSEDVAQRGSDRELQRVHANETPATRVCVKAGHLQVDMLLHLYPLGVREDEITSGIDRQPRHVEGARVYDLWLPHCVHGFYSQALAAAELENTAVHRTLQNRAGQLVVQPLPVHFWVVARDVADLSTRAPRNHRKGSDIDVDPNGRRAEDAHRNAPLQAICRHGLEEGRLLRREEPDAVLLSTKPQVVPQPQRPHASVLQRGMEHDDVAASTRPQEVHCSLQRCSPCSRFA